MNGACKSQISGLILGVLLTLPTTLWSQQQETQRGTVLLIDRVEQTAHVPVPRRGQSMDSVEAEFGAPEAKEGPVGEPPITRWVYKEFTVYFESTRVIHAVVNQATPSESLG